MTTRTPDPCRCGGHHGGPRPRPRLPIERRTESYGDALVSRYMTESVVMCADGSVVAEVQRCYPVDHNGRRVGDWIDSRMVLRDTRTGREITTRDVDEETNR